MAKQWAPAPEETEQPGPPRTGGRAASVGVLLVGTPVLGALVDELLHARPGAIFTVCTVLGTVLAAAASSRSGAWWVAIAPPALVLAVTAAVELPVHADRYRQGRFAAAAARWLIDGFPAMTGAVLGALAVIVVRLLREGRERRGGRG